MGLLDWFIPEKDEHFARRRCFETLTANNITAVCNYKTGKEITSKQDFIYNVKIPYSKISYVWHQYAYVKNCLNEIDAVGFAPCESLRSIWKKQLTNLNITVISNDSIWDKKSFSTHKCIELFKLNDFELCLNKNITIANNTQLLATLINISNWRIETDYINTDSPLLLCIKEFEGKGFTNCSEELISTTDHDSTLSDHSIDL